MAQQQPGAPPQGFEGIWNLLGAAGFPAPQVAMQELQRLNATMEMLAPDLHLIAQEIGSVQQLAQGLQKLDPEQIKQLVAALNGASSTGDKFYERIWGKKAK